MQLGCSRNRRHVNLRGDTGETIAVLLRSGFGYQIVQSADPREWDWTLFHDGNSIRTGICRNRSVAILDALRAIQNAKKNTRKAKQN
jgi:hypothetical protein